MKSIGTHVLLWFGLVLAVCASACIGSGPAEKDAGQGVAVVIESVTARQYRGVQKQFEFRAARLSLDERAEILTAQGEIEASIEPAAFERSEQ